MSQVADVVVLSGRTPQIENAERRYIDALEKRISALELQIARNPPGRETLSSLEQCPAQDEIHNEDGHAIQRADDKFTRAGPPTNSIADVHGTQRDEEEELSMDFMWRESKSLRNLTCVQVYARFFNTVKITARRRSGVVDELYPKFSGDEEVISDPTSKAALGTTSGDSLRKPASSGAVPEKDAEKDKTPAPISLALQINQDDVVFKATAMINDLNLLSLLQIFLAHDPGFGPDLPVLSLDSPFEPIIQHWWDLKALIKGDADHSVVQQFRNRVQKFKAMDDELTTWPRNLSQFVHDDHGVDKTKANLELLMDLVYEATRGRSGEHSLLRLLQDDPSQIQGEIVSFENLWFFFRPGHIVISHLFQDEPQAFIVEESNEIGMERDYEADRPRKPRYWTLFCWSYDWTGKIFKRIPVQLRIDYFKGTRKLSMLSVYPIKFLPQKVKEEMEERGRRFHDICIREKGSRVFQYSGEAILRGSGIGKVQLVQSVDRLKDERFPRMSLYGDIYRNQDATNVTIVEIDGNEQVMVDALSFRQDGPGKHYQQKLYQQHQMPMGKVRFAFFEECRCSICQQNFCLAESQRTQYDLEASDLEFKDSVQYLICPPRVLGYHLSRKRWVELNVNGVHDVERRVDTTAFEKLQMESSRSKELLKTLVTSHWKKKRSDSKGKMTDLMKGKGESLVILLYGPPGVGKTLTAESVAKASGKPLLFVTVADIGLNPEKIEENLMHVFRLAASWEAIVLFDEADVFLESRSSDTASLERNSLVSELLRVLEYYDGMLILTTNRLRRFDHAVMSRINLAVRYPDLTHSQKVSIFKHFIEQLDADSTVDLKRILDWIEDEDTREQLDVLNGRQIRNILFSAARMTSEQEGGRLSLDAIKQLTQATKRFAVEIHAEQEAARTKNEPGYR